MHTTCLLYCICCLWEEQLVNLVLASTAVQLPNTDKKENFNYFGWPLSYIMCSSIIIDSSLLFGAKIRNILLIYTVTNMQGKLACNAL